MPNYIWGAGPMFMKQSWFRIAGKQYSVGLPELLWSIDDDERECTVYRGN